jgi:hypothetical protein
LNPHSEADIACVQAMSVFFLSGACDDARLNVHHEGTHDTTFPIPSLRQFYEKHRSFLVNPRGILPTLFEPSGAKCAGQAMGGRFVDRRLLSCISAINQDNSWTIKT